MSTPYLGEVKIISFTFPPKGWAFCNGQLMAIQQNAALFSLLGTFYGGDGIRTFALPNLQGRSAFHVGSGFTIGQAGGEAEHTLITAEMPQHTHTPNATTGGATLDTPATGVWCASAGSAYSASSNATMQPASILPNGGSQPHNNMSPYLVLNMIIALQGIFPTRG